MIGVWTELLPLVVVSAALPLQTVMTLTLLRSSLRAAYAWVVGMVVVRLLQGFLFGYVLAPGADEGASEPRLFLGAVFLVLSLLLYVKACRTVAGAADEDAPPPTWMTGASAMSPLAAFGAGAAFMTLSVKFMVFTLAASSAITYAEIGATPAMATFVLFVVLSHVGPLGVLVLASSSSAKSAAVLNGSMRWLQRNSRVITVVLAVVFGSFFLLKALRHLGFT